MTMSKQITRIAHRIIFSCAAMALILGPIGAGVTSAAEGLQVQIDQTVPVKLDRPAATVVVGNPAVADITAQSNKLFFIVGRTMGATNVVALDAAGEQIANITIHVTSIQSGHVSLHRGAFRESYSCATKCERTQMPGDEFEANKELVEAISKKLAIAKQGREASN